MAALSSRTLLPPPATSLLLIAASPSARSRSGALLGAAAESLLNRWADGHAKEVAVLLAPQIGLDATSTELAAGRFSYGIQPIHLSIAAEQQKMADAFFALKLIPKPLRISDALPQALRTAAK